MTDELRVFPAVVLGGVWDYFSISKRGVVPSLDYIRARITKLP